MKGAKLKGRKESEESGPRLPGKERNRAGLNLLDCLQLRASFLPFPPPLTPDLSLLALRCGEKTADDSVRGRADSSRFHLSSMLLGVNWTFFIVNL